MKNAELKFTEQKKLTLTKRNYFIIVIPIILILILVMVIAYYVFIYNNDSNKLKRYLDNLGYNCNKEVCSLEKKDGFYTVFYENKVLMVDKPDFQIRLGSGVPVLEERKDGNICTFMKNDYQKFDYVDESFVMNNKCKDYIDDVNKAIDVFKDILENSKVLN